MKPKMHSSTHTHILYTDHMKHIHSFIVPLWLVAAALLLTMTCPIAHADMSKQVLAQEPQPTLVWQRINDMPAGVFEAAVSKQGRRAIVTGGLNQAGQASVLVQVLDLDTLTWTTPLKLNEGVSYHTQVTLADGRIFIAGGKTGSLLDKLTQVAHTWVISADLKTVEAGPDLPVKAHKLTSHLLADGKVAVIGNRLASIYDPATNTWTNQITLRDRRAEHASVLLPDGKIVVAGGVGRNTIELVDIQNRRSIQLASQFSGPRDDLAAALLPDGRVLIMGGQDSKTGLTIDENLVLDLSDSRKSVLTPTRAMGIPGGASDMAVATLGRWIFALGGETDLGNRDVELTEARVIDGKTLELWSLPKMAVAHDDALAVTDGNSVLVIGGYSVSKIKIGPLETTMPTAVHIVERLVLPVEKFK